MKLLLNTLATTNASGRSVLLGHLGRVIKWAGDTHEFLGLCHPANRDLRELLPGCINWIECPSWTGHWAGRTLWERTALRGLLRDERPDAMFMASGTVVENCALPQISMAMNPWSLVPDVLVTRRARVKAWLQRRAYAGAVRRATLMVYISRYIREAYVANAKREENAYVIAHAALNDDVLAVASRNGARCRHQADRVVCVSAMAPHKGVETILRALAVLRAQYRVPAVLHLVGGWPDAQYRRSIDRLVGELSLGEAVRVHGFVSREALFEHYACAKVFCLMSRCESFGIPALEAQCFGTPVVSSNCCAIPEVCGTGGFFPDPGDSEETARALARLLREPETWVDMSTSATANASQFTYERTARPLMRMFELV